MSFNAAAYDGPFGFEKNNNHHVGFGISTNLFGSSQLLGGLAYNATNGFDTKINTNNIVYLKSQNSFSVFAEYHYNFSQWNAVATHIKWNYKDLNYGMTGGNTGDNYANLVREIIFS